MKGLIIFLFSLFVCINTYAAPTLHPPHKRIFEARYEVTSKWNGGAYINIFFTGGGSWQAFVTYTLPMTIDNITGGSYMIDGNTIIFTPSPGNTTLPIGAQLKGNGEPDPNLSYVLAEDGTKYPFTNMPVPPTPIPDTFHIKIENYLPTGPISIGQMDLPSVWDSGPFSMLLPNERKGWALALAHAEQLFKNVTHVTDLYTGPNHYQATVIQESRFSADPDSASFTYPFPINYPIMYQANTQIDGFFQIEGAGGGSAFGDMKVLYPNRFGSLDHSDVISGNKFETSAITSAYYNIYMYQFLIGAGYRPHDFFSKARDPQALDRVMALVYNRGAYSEYVKNVFVDNREYCIALKNMADEAGRCLPNNGDYGSLYVRQVPGFNKSLVDAAKLGEGYPGLYTAEISWNDVNAYLDKIAILYPPEDIAKARKDAQAEFNKLQTNGKIDYASQYGYVLDKIMLALPVDTATNMLCNVYSKCETETFTKRAHA